MFHSTQVLHDKDTKHVFITSLINEITKGILNIFCGYLTLEGLHYTVLVTIDVCACII